NQILYKAKKNGIRVYYVNPYLTSKRCPDCGRINNPIDRMYQCECGLRAHRDLVGARNILVSQVVGTSLRC
ncbi:MAG: zinc ribbon domain-containing protein, partial [Erysipelotrichaceae bacterium]